MAIFLVGRHPAVPRPKAPLLPSSGDGARGGFLGKRSELTLCLTDTGTHIFTCNTHVFTHAYVNTFIHTQYTHRCMHTHATHVFIGTPHTHTGTKAMAVEGAQLHP